LIELPLSQTSRFFNSFWVVFTDPQVAGVGMDEIPLKEIIGMFHPCLTLSEGVKLAVMSFTTDVKKMSCCAS